MNSKKISTCGHYKSHKNYYIHPLNFLWSEKDLQMKEDKSDFIRLEEFGMKKRWRHLYWCYNVMPFHNLEEGSGKTEGSAGEVSWQGHEEEASSSWINAHEADFMVFSLLPGCSESRCQQEALTRKAGWQGLPGLNAGGFGAGTAGPWDCHRAQGPLCFLPETDCWKGGMCQDDGPTAAICVSVCVCLCPTKDCPFSLHSKTV